MLPNTRADDENRLKTVKNVDYFSGVWGRSRWLAGQDGYHLFTDLYQELCIVNAFTDMIDAGNFLIYS